MSYSVEFLAKVWLRAYLNPIGGDMTQGHEDIFISYAQQYFHEAYLAYEQGLLLASSVTAFAGFEATAKAFSPSEELSGEKVFTAAISLIKDNEGLKDILTVLEIARSLYNKNPQFRISNQDPYRNGLLHGDLSIPLTEEYVSTLIEMLRTLSIVLKDPEMWNGLVIDQI